MRPRRWDGGWQPDEVPPSPEEASVAIVIDGQSQAVLMASPFDLADLALGFALTEGMIDGPAQVQGSEVVPVTLRDLPAYEARLWLAPGTAAHLAERRRHMIGPVGCGLCGIDQLDQALPQVIPVTADLTVTPAQVIAAMAALAEGQERRRDTPALHGAAFLDAQGALVREDVGRHNALDKLAGALAGQGRTGLLALSSRLSVDLVQKAARIGAPVLIGAAAPTTLAVAWANAAGITLIARARATGFEVHTHSHRLKD